MIFLLALIPATVLVVAGYFVLYLSQRSEGRLQGFGKYLSFWAFTLAGLVILGALFAAAHGHHGGMGCARWQGGMMQHRYGSGEPPGAPPASEPAPRAAPISPAPAQ